MTDTAALVCVACGAETGNAEMACEACKKEAAEDDMGYCSCCGTSIRYGSRCYTCGDKAVRGIYSCGREGDLCHCRKQDNAPSLSRRPATQKEWRDAVKEFKWSMYMATSCGQGSAWEAHMRLMEFLSQNPHLRQSKHGQHYIERTKSISHLFDAAASIEAVIENTLADGLGTGGLKYWSR